jgi:hypothetical protein
MGMNLLQNVSVNFDLHQIKLKNHHSTRNRGKKRSWLILSVPHQLDLLQFGLLEYYFLMLLPFVILFPYAIKSITDWSLKPSMENFIKLIRRFKRKTIRKLCIFKKLGNSCRFEMSCSLQNGIKCFVSISWRLNQPSCFYLVQYN